MNERELYNTVWDLSSRSHEVAGAKNIIAMAEANWPEIEQRPATPEDAETCRLIMLAAGTLNSSVTAVWRARALARFRAVGWHEAVGLMLISAAFAQLASDNNFYPEGKTLDVVKPSDSAMKLIRQAESFLDTKPSGYALREGAPTAARLKRQYPEKLGFLQLINSEIDAAVSSYESALAAAEDERGILRTRLALALVDYLNVGGGPTAATATEGLAARARALGPAGADIVAAAEHNAVVMRHGGAAVVPYERL